MSGIRQSLIDEIHKKLGGWPPRPGALEKVVTLVEDDVVKLLTASGTPDDCVKKVRAYVDAGCTCPLLCPIGDNISDLIEAFADD